MTCHVYPGTPGEYAGLRMDSKLAIWAPEVSIIVLKLTWTIHVHSLKTFVLIVYSCIDDRHWRKATCPSWVIPEWRN